MENIRLNYKNYINKELIKIYLDKFVACDFQRNKRKVAELAD